MGEGVYSWKRPGSGERRDGYDSDNGRSTWRGNGEKEMLGARVSTPCATSVGDVAVDLVLSAHFIGTGEDVGCSCRWGVSCGQGRSKDDGLCSCT